MHPSQWPACERVLVMALPREGQRKGEKAKKIDINKMQQCLVKAERANLEMSACTRPWARWQIGQHDVAFLAASKGSCTRSTIRLVTSVVRS